MNTSIEKIEILLVEDNLDDVALVREALEEDRTFNNIIHLRDGAVAMEYLFREGDFAGFPEDRKPKVIMLDLNMPRMGGMELLRMLKADDRTKNIPVVVFTSSDDDPHLKECYDLGVNNYIVKPIDIEQFKKSIKKTITGLLLYSSHFWPS